MGIDHAGVAARVDEQFQSSETLVETVERLLPFIDRTGKGGVAYDQLVAAVVKEKVRIALQQVRDRLEAMGEDVIGPPSQQQLDDAARRIALLRHPELATMPADDWTVSGELTENGRTLTANVSVRVPAVKQLIDVEIVQV